MAIDAEDVKKIAKLAKLNLSDQEISMYDQELNDILDFVQQLDQVDTQGIQPLAHPLNVSQRLREDKVTESDQHQLFQATAPHVEAGLYLVPQVISQDSEN